MKVCVLEYDFILSMSILASIIGMVFYGISRLNQGKKASKSGSDGVKDMYSVYSEQIKDILKLKDNHIKRLNAEIQNSIGSDDETDQEPAKYEDLKALAKEAGINPLILEMPFIKNNIKKYTKGMSIEEIISTVNELKKFIPNKKPEQQIEGFEQNSPNNF